MIVGDLDFRALRGGPKQVFMLLRNFGNAIIVAKGTANDPDTKTTPQLVAAARAAAVALPALIDAGNPGPVLASIVRLAAIATVIQARLA